MNSSPNERRDLLLDRSALQHERAPRPLPLFLELVREVSSRDPALAVAALVGLRAYERAPRRQRPAPKNEIARVRGATLRDYGGEGPPAILVPSLINPPRILDLDDEVSLAQAIARMGRRAILLDWGKSSDRHELSIAGHVETLLLPLIESVRERVALIGYCLGGTMTIAAANLAKVESVTTLASPWHFAAYPPASKKSLVDMWRHSEGAAKIVGALPMEVLQSAFWSLDPERTVRKFAEFGKLDSSDANVRRFVELEEWANDGEPLPYAAASELFEAMFRADEPGAGMWRVAGRTMSDRLSVPAIHLTAARDLIAPPETVASGEVVQINSGHVGMIVGSARQQLHMVLRGFLDPGCR